MEKRTIILVIIFSILGAVLLLSTFFTCTGSDEFDCLMCAASDAYAYTCIGCPQTKHECNSNYYDCTWHPLFMGCADNAPVIFGISLKTGGPFPENGWWVSEGLLDAKTEYRNITGNDYTIKNISYTITTPKGTYTATTFDEIISSEPVRKYEYIGAASNDSTVTIEIDIEAHAPIENLYAEAEICYLGTPSSVRSKVCSDTVTGNHTIKIEVETGATSLLYMDGFNGFTIHGKIATGVILEGE